MDNEQSENNITSELETETDDEENHYCFYQSYDQNFEKFSNNMD